jgi:hypothetical protein
MAAVSKIRVGLVFLLLLLLPPHIAFSQDSSGAEDAATRFLRDLDSDDLAVVYDDYMSSSFKAQFDKRSFSQNSGMLRIQSGGPAMTRTLVGSQAFDRLPTGKQGEFFYVRNKAAHPAGSVFEDVYLEREGGKWLVTGFYFFPAPP